MNAFVAKPVRREELAEVLQGFLNGKCQTYSCPEDAAGHAKRR